MAHKSQSPAFLLWRTGCNHITTMQAAESCFKIYPNEIFLSRSVFQPGVSTLLFVNELNDWAAIAHCYLRNWFSVRRSISWIFFFFLWACALCSFFVLFQVVYVYKQLRWRTEGPYICQGRSGTAPGSCSGLMLTMKARVVFCTTDCLELRNISWAPLPVENF